MPRERRKKLSMALASLRRMSLASVVSVGVALRVCTYILFVSNCNTEKETDRKGRDRVIAFGGSLPGLTVSE